MAALACEALNPLLADDDLDFYKTWPLVARILNPRRMLGAVGVQEEEEQRGLGGDPAGSDDQQQQEQWYRGGAAAASSAASCALRHTAAGWCVAAWVGLLQYGVMDAGTQPDMAAGVVRLLWLATGANEAQVGGVLCLSVWALWW